MSTKTDALQQFADRQMQSQKESLDQYERALAEASPGYEMPPEVVQTIQDMKAASDTSSPDFDPDVMMVSQLRGVLQMGALGGADPTRDLAEASVRDGQEIVLLVRIKPNHLAGLRVLARVRGSYEAALHAVLDSFGRK